MTDLQMQIFEAIIAFLKNNNGEGGLYSLDKRQLGVDTNASPKEFSESFQFVKRQMKLQGYIDYRYETNKNFFVLTTKGSSFTTFRDLERQQAEEKDRQEIQDKVARKELEKLNLEIDDLVNKLSDYDKVKTQAKWSLIVAIISAVGTIAAAVIAMIALQNK